MPKTIKSLKYINMRFIITSFLTFFFFSSSAQKVVDKIVGIVGNNIILLSDIESQYQQYVQQYGANVPDGTRCELLDQLMTQKLLLAQSLIDSVVVSDEEVESELDKRVRYFSNITGGITKLEEYYGKIGRAHV